MSDLTPDQRAAIVAERANVKYGPYASLHEAYGVLAEEVAEYYEAEDKTTTNGGADFVTFEQAIFKGMRDNDCNYCVANAGEMYLRGKGRAEELMREHDEAIDVMAVCQRIIEQWGPK